MLNHSILINSNTYFTRIMMKSDPVITYNHMEDDHAQSKMRHFKKSLSSRLIYLAELAIILALIAIMFLVF